MQLSRLELVTPTDMRKTNCGFFIWNWEAKCSAVWDVFSEIYRGYVGDANATVEGNWSIVTQVVVLSYPVIIKIKIITRHSYGGGFDSSRQLKHQALLV